MIEWIWWIIIFLILKFNNDWLLIFWDIWWFLIYIVYYCILLMVVMEERIILEKFVGFFFFVFERIFFLVNLYNNLYLYMYKNKKFNKFEWKGCGNILNKGYCCSFEIYKLNKIIYL